MKLERYKDKKETRKKAMLIGLTVITLISITMILYKTFAKFTTTTSFTIMSGKVIYKKNNDQHLMKYLKIFCKQTWHLLLIK